MILFIDQSGSVGGGQTVLLSLIKAARLVDEEIVLLAPGGGDLHAEVEERFRGRITFVPCERPQFTLGKRPWTALAKMLAYTFRFRKHLPLLRASNLVYANGARQLPTLLLLAPFFRRRIILHVHTDYGFFEKLLLRVVRFLPNTRAIICNSDFVAKRLGVRCKIIENALDDRFAVLPYADRFSASFTKIRAAVIGEIAPHKGQDMAVAGLKDQLADLYLIGLRTDSAYQPTSVGAVNVFPINPTRDIPAAFERLGIQFNLVPSKCNEAFGLAAIEGMACSAITIVSGRGGLAEIAKRTGALIARDDKDIARTLKRLLEQPRGYLSTLANSQYNATMKFYNPARFQDRAEEIIRVAYGSQRNERAPL